MTTGYSVFTSLAASFLISVLRFLVGRACLDAHS